MNRFALPLIATTLGTLVAAVVYQYYGRFTRCRCVFRFSLRTLFVLTAIVGAWLAYSRSWIRQRHAFLDSGVGVECMDEDPSLPKPFQDAPGGLGLFGEDGVHAIWIRWENDREKTERLFPEAQVFHYK